MKSLGFEKVNGGEEKEFFRNYAKHFLCVPSTLGEAAQFKMA